MITRRQFLTLTGAAILAGSAFSLSGCASEPKITEAQYLQAAVKDLLNRAEKAKKPFGYDTATVGLKYLADNGPAAASMSGDEIKSALLGKRIAMVNDLGWSLAGKETVFYTFDESGNYKQFGRFYDGKGEFKEGVATQPCTVSEGTFKLYYEYELHKIAEGYYYGIYYATVSGGGKMAHGALVYERDDKGKPVCALDETAVGKPEVTTENSSGEAKPSGDSKYGSASIIDIKIEKASNYTATATVSFSWTNTTGKSATFDDCCKVRAFTPSGADMPNNITVNGAAIVDDGQTVKRTCIIEKIACAKQDAWYFEIIPIDAKFESFKACNSALTTKTETI